MATFLSKVRRFLHSGEVPALTQSRSEHDQLIPVEKIISGKKESRASILMPAHTGSAHTLLVMENCIGVSNRRFKHTKERYFNRRCFIPQFIGLTSLSQQDEKMGDQIMFDLPAID